MNRILKLTAPLFAIALTLALVAGTQANDPGNKATLDKVDLGTHVYGPKVEAKDFTGKVTVFEYWGDRCPPCIRSIPHLVEVQKEHGSDKLVIVANQVWTKEVDAAKNAWKNAGGSDAITVINHGKLDGAKLKGVPHAFVFDHTGKLVWNGHPLDKQFDKEIDKAVKAMPSQS